MNIRFYIKIIVGLLIVKFAFAEVIDVDDQEMIKLSNDNIPLVDVRRSSEWNQTGIIPNSILLTFFDKEGNYNFDEWYKKLQLEINEGDPIILICRSGKRSKVVANMIDEKFNTIIYNAQSGINSWISKKLITVKPGEKLSLQMHHHRSEHWIIVSGTARVEVDNKVDFLSENQSVYIPLGSKHRLTNPGKIPLKLVEVQSGSYVGEDDIVRIQDKYGRKKK